MPQKPNSQKNGSQPIRLMGDWLQDGATKKVFEVLNCNGDQTRAVGGAVRNTLLGLPAADIDFATTAAPETVSKLAIASGMSAHPTGIDHGTVTLVCDNKTFEVTTLRKDVSTDGRRATVAFTTDWEEDARRRDFTINALYCDADGTLFDPLGGHNDIQSRTIRFIDDPHQRIREDTLRILRFFRFFATYGHDPIDNDGLVACSDLKAGIGTLSGERIRNEILKLLATNDPRPALRHMTSAGIWHATFSKSIDLEPFSRLIDIDHTHAFAPDGLLRLAVAMVHEESDAADLTTRLKLSNIESNRLQRIAAYAPNHKAEKPLARKSESDQRKALYNLGSQAYKDVCLWQWAHSDAPADEKKYIATLDLPNRWTLPKLPFSGANLIASGQTPGPQIGRTLSRFESWWIQNDFPTDLKLLEDKLAEFTDDN